MKCSFNPSTWRDEPNDFLYTYFALKVPRGKATFYGIKELLHIALPYAIGQFSKSNKGPHFCL